jgi:hypothetical protein
MFKPTRKILHVVSVFFVAGSVFLASCKDDDESIRPSVEIPDQFSDNTPEENKAALEDNGIELVNNLESFKSTNGVKTLISLNSCLNSGSLPEGGRVGTENPAGKMFRVVSSFGSGTATAKDVLSAMRIREDEPLSPQEEFDAAAGVYAFNRADSTWTKTASSDKIVFQFPSTDVGTENNAEVSIYDFTTVVVSNPEAGYEDDLPTGVKAELKVDGTAIVEYSFAASYKSNGEPTSVNTSLTIAPFKFSFIAKNTTSEVAVDYAFTMSDENLISFGMGASGEFTSENALGEGSGPASVVNDASAYFQLMNIKFAGKVDIKKWSELIDETGSMQNMADAWNGSTELVVYYADSKEKIADGEFYVNTVEDYCWDTDGDFIDDECYSSEIVDIRLVFADESKADLATYTDEGFDELSTTFEEFMTELDEDLG